MRKIPYGQQQILEEDIQAVVEVLKSDFLTQGPTVEKFEQEFARYVGAQYAVAVCNATAALHLSFKVLNRDANKKVLVTPLTFAASANCVLFEGGTVEFVDIDSKSYLMDLNLLEDRPKIVFINNADHFFLIVIKKIRKSQCCVIESESEKTDSE